MQSTLTHADSDAEQAVIGAVLLDIRALAQVPTVEVADFTDGHRAAIWSAIRNLEADGRPIDLVTIGDEVEKGARLKSTNDQTDHGPPFRAACEFELGTCALRCPIAERVLEYAEIMRRHRLTRDCVKTLVGILAVANRGSLEGDELIAEASGEIMRLGEGRSGEDPGVTVGRIVADECARIASEDGNPNATAAGMPSGLQKLDELTGGIPFAVTTLWLARPGMGKTTLAQNVAWAASVLGNDTPLLYSYEDGLASFAQRSMAQSSGVPTERIRARNFRAGDMANLHSARRRMLSRREVIVRAAGMSVDEMIRDARSRRMKGSKDGSTVGRLVLVDYVQKMPEPNGSTRNERLGVLSRRLSEFAAKDGIAVVVCSQINRGVEGRDDHVPRLSDARDCGELEQDCKLALGLYRPWRYDPDHHQPTHLELHVLKNHNGQTDCHASVFWDLETHTICDSANELNARRAMEVPHAHGN
ncbi:MAG: hypothetical protein H0U46_05615 [Actinobacteria bacterium]|nr:hypothetical protein [Actinomycetota bacterium]